MDPSSFYSQQHFPQQQGGGPGANNSFPHPPHNYFVHQQNHFLQGQEQQQNYSSNTNYPAPYRSLYPSAADGLESQHPSSGLLIPKVEIEEQPPSPASQQQQPPPAYSTPPGGAGGSSEGPPATPNRPPPKDNNDSYQCSICYECFPTAKTYKNHMANHKLPVSSSPAGCSNESGGVVQDDNWQNCKYCNKTFTDVNLMNNHILEHVRDHQQQMMGVGDGGLLEKCQYCYKLFADHIQLQIHLREHNALKEYKCLNCHKMYASLNYLKLHYKMHADEKPYKCTYCDKRFTFSSNLYVHHRIHTGHKPYRCEKCSKCFSQINSLKQHHRIHRDQTPQPATQPHPSLVAALPLPNPSAIIAPLLPNGLPLSMLPSGSGLGEQSLMGLNKSNVKVKDEFNRSEGGGGHNEDKVLNMSRPPGAGELSIQDVIIQQLQQRLVSQ